MHSTRKASKTIFRLSVFLVTATVFASELTSVFAIPLYDVTDLGALSNSPSYSEADAINNYGQVVGYSAVNNVDYSAYLWTPTSPNAPTGCTTNLGTLPGEPNQSIAWGINDSGQVVGQTTDPLTSYRGFVWTPNTPNGTTGSMVDIGSLPGGNGDAGAGAINNLGQIVGQSSAPAANQAFLWTPTSPNGPTGNMIDLGSLPGDTGVSQARAINSDGQIAGGTATSAFLWTPTGPNGSTGNMIDLGALPRGAGETGALAMNDGGQVVGFSGTDAFLWTPTSANATTGNMQDLGFLPGDNFSYSFGVNDLGQVVGFSGQIALPAASDQQAALWTSATGFVNLNDYLDPVNGQGWNLFQATGINDAGQIVGRGYINGVEHGYLLTPTPEPSSIVLAVVALLGLAAWGKHAHKPKKLRL